MNQNLYQPNPWQDNISPQNPYTPYANNGYPPAGNYPIQPPQYSYNSDNTPAYAAPNAQNQLNPGYVANSRRRPLFLAILLFPLMCLKVFLLPTPGTFNAEKDRAGGGFLSILLLAMAVVAYGLAYIWGRVPQIGPVVHSYSGGRITPQAISTGMCAFIALGTPILYVLLIGTMQYMSKRMGGYGVKGSFVVQSYATSLVIVPVISLSIILAAVLIFVQPLNPSLRLGLGVIELFVIGYGFILQVLAVMGVHGLPASKSAIVVISAVVVLLAVLAIATLFLMTLSGESSSGGGSSKKSSESRGSRSDGDFFFNDNGSGNGHHQKHRRNMLMMACPSCGWSLQNLRGQQGMPCPKCGLPMQPYQP